MNEVLINDSVVGVVLGCKRDPSPRKVISTALDGAVYIQVVGTATDNRRVSVYCSTATKRKLLDKASNEGAPITLYWNGEALIGYISDVITWKEWRDEHGVGAFNLIVDNVQNVV